MLPMRWRKPAWRKALVKRVYQTRRWPPTWPACQMRSRGTTPRAGRRSVAMKTARLTATRDWVTTGARREGRSVARGMSTGDGTRAVGRARDGVGGRWLESGLRAARRRELPTRTAEPGRTLLFKNRLRHAPGDRKS